MESGFLMGCLQVKIHVLEQTFSLARHRNARTRSSVDCGMHGTGVHEAINMVIAAQAFLRPPTGAHAHPVLSPLSFSRPAHGAHSYI